jgi:hypothetical protein
MMTGFPKALMAQLQREIDSYEDTKTSLGVGTIPIEDSKAFTPDELLDGVFVALLFCCI